MELSPEEHGTQRQRRVGKGMQGGQAARAEAQGWDRAGGMNLKKLHVGSYAGLKTTIVRRGGGHTLFRSVAFTLTVKEGRWGFRPGCKIGFMLQKDHAA